MAYLSATWIINAFSPGNVFFATARAAFTPFIIAWLRLLMGGPDDVDGFSLPKWLRAYQGRSDTFSVAERTETTE